MNKCFVFTILMLAYLVAVVDSQPSYMCQKDDETKCENKKSPDLRLEFTSDTISDITSKQHYFCDVITKESGNIIQCNETEISYPISCSDADPEWLQHWSEWTDCAMSNGKGIMYRYRDVTSASGETTCCLGPCISLVDIKVCQLHAGDLSSWSSWSECITSGEGFKHRSLICHSNQSECTVPSYGSSFEISKCIPDPGNLSSWSSWSECITSGEGFKHRSLICHSNQSECLVPSNGSTFEIIKCIPDSASSATGLENGKEVEKRYTLTEIILVALCCLLMGVLLTTLVFVLYMKRTQRGCFSKDINNVQGDSKQQSGPDNQVRFLTESVVVKKYDSNNPKSADSTNENKAEETQYQSLNSNQVGNDQQTYDELKVNEPRSDNQGHQPSSSRLQHTGNDYQIDQIPNLQSNNEGVYEYCRGSDIDGHNYFVLERENMSREFRARNLGRPETHAEVGDEIKDSTLGAQDKQSDAAH